MYSPRAGPGVADHVLVDPSAVDHLAASRGLVSPSAGRAQPSRLRALRGVDGACRDALGLHVVNPAGRIGARSTDSLALVREPGFPTHIYRCATRPATLVRRYR